MPLSAGDKLGPYEVSSVIGAGGMGEVYKARDTRLDRTVAIACVSNAKPERSHRGTIRISARSSIIGSTRPPTNRVLALSYTAKGDSLAAGKPRVWREARLRNVVTASSDLPPDGKRLAAIFANDASEKLPTSLTFC